jgi:hypothetical protein
MRIQGQLQIRGLTTLGVTDVVQISIDGAEGEGQVLLQWCDAQHLRSIVAAGTKDRSRRLRRVLRHSRFDPDQWWDTRDGARKEIVELQQLLLDVVLHPLSF